jgi:predicted AlkP superfamily pyrophosphatase or phosphodiesterase
VTRTHARARLLTPLVLVAALAASACGAVDPSGPSDTAELAAARRAPTATYVVAITIDGLNPKAIGALGRNRAWGFVRMIENGASTLNARTAYERTETMPNHSSLFTGRRVEDSHAHHVTFNDDEARTDIHSVADEYVTSMFDVVHDRGRRTLFFAGKEKFAFWNRSWSSTFGAPDTTGLDDGRDKITAYRYGEASAMTDALVSSLRTRPAALSYLHVPLPDKAGHAYGFMTQPYLQAVEASAKLVNRVLTAIRRDDHLRGRTTVVLTADHGGGGGAKSHSDPTLLRNYRIPFMVWGAGARAGTDLYRLNPERVEPGTSRPGYGSRPPIRNLDLADLVTTLLGYPPVPGGISGLSTGLTGSGTAITPLEVS